ncbi:MAG: HAD family phosphatase [Cypionkella sp.]|uniref:HAD family hydrolase n=1 Tax=Cypionkella sp. TaxID=2811411 RepID=UPI002AB85188|nr:HAD family phosphatase [Cypionkella sp.]MDZ4311426.1 HAD family phosphatase [Cypionkella sp.]
MTPKAVIFDCDGVVVDSEPMLFDLLAADLEQHGLPMAVETLHHTFLGMTLQGLREKANAMGASLPADWCDDFYTRLYAQLRLGTPLIPGILTVLDALDAAGIPYAMGSNGSAEKMQITLGQHGLIPRFKGLFSGQTLGKPKPAPDLYLHAAAALGVAPNDCIVIEDSPTGARAARAAGMRCMGYAPDGNAALAAEGAVLFSDMKDLPKLLGF